jgi:hypothetical protein
VKHIKWIFLVYSIFAPASAWAWDWNVAGKPTMIEPTYIPGFIIFSLNVAAGPCAAGSFLKYEAKGANDAEKQANIQAVFATLLTAQARNASLSVYGNNSGCIVTNIWLFS